MENKKYSQATGIIITLVAGTIWGFTGTCSQFLFERYDVTPLFMTNVRLLISGVILVIVSLIMYRDALFALLRNKSDVIRLLVFGLLGILFNQLSYLETIDHTNSGTATIIQYLGPVLIMVVSCVMAKRLPTKIELLAIMLAIIGTWLIATHGDFLSLYITKEGLIWGLLSAVAAVFYTMLPVKLIKEYGSIPVVGCGMVAAGTGLTVFNRFKGAPSNPDARFIIVFAIIVFVGTVVAYTAYLLGVSICGPVKASMIASIEPVSATVFMVIWLGEKFYAIDFVGFFCIFITVFLLARPEKNQPPTART